MIIQKLEFRKVKLVSCLNGKSPLCLPLLSFQSLQRQNRQKQWSNTCTVNSSKDNSVPTQILPRKQPGIYMIHCTQNDRRYYGQSRNVSGRLASHRYLLRHCIHPNFALQQDYNKYGSSFFEYKVIFLGEKWTDSSKREKKETEFIQLNRILSYNVLESSSRPGKLNPFWGRYHTSTTKHHLRKRLKNKPNYLLGKKIRIKQVLYLSIAEASRKTGMARKTIRKKINDPSERDYLIVENLSSVKRPSQRE